MTAPTRPVLRYHGGKWRLAPWVLSFFPAHRTYVEPFGGGASVLMRKARAYAEVYNDLDGEVVNVFRVLREPEKAERLEQLLRLTPFARREFRAAYGRDLPGDVERARRTIIKSFMGFGSGALHDDAPAGMRTRASTHRAPPTGFRGSAMRSGTTPADDWMSYPVQVAEYCRRLRGVIIEQRDARTIIETHDRESTLHYCDPPYPLSTRKPTRRMGGKAYRHELTDDDHRGLAATLHACVGMVIVSGYACPMYDLELYPDWERHEREHLADGARPRVEVVWLNHACSAALRAGRDQGSLLMEVVGG